MSVKKAILFLVCLFASAAKATTLTGSIKYPDGTGVTGSIKFRLSQQGSQMTTGGCGGPAAIAGGNPFGPEVSFALTAGSLPGGASVVGNDCIQPPNTYYVVRVLDQGQNVLFQENWTVTGVTIDVGTILPIIVPQGTASIGTALITNLTVTGTFNFLAGTMAGNITFPGNVTFSGVDTFTNQIIGSQGSSLNPSSVGAFYNLTGNTFSGNAPDMQFNGTGAGATDNTATGTFLQIPLRSTAMTQASNNGRIFGALFEYRHTVNDAGGDKVGLQFGARSTVGAAVNDNLWAGNAVLTSKDAPGTGKFQTLEVDHSNASGVDWTTSNSTGLSTVAGGSNKVGVGLDVNFFAGNAARWLTGLRIAGASNIGIDIQNNPTTTMNVGGNAIMAVGSGNAWGFTNGSGSATAVMRLTPGLDSATTAILFGTNAANTIVNWQVNQNGAAVFPSIGPSTAQQHTLPAVASDTIALLAAAQAFTTKTVDISLNTLKTATNTAGHYPRNNGTQYVDNTIQGGDLPVTVVQVAAVSNLTAQQANVAATTLLTPAANGFFRITCYTVITQAATTSSTVPTCQVNWTDADTSVAETQNIGVGSTANIVGTVNSSGTTSTYGFFAKAGVAITFGTSAYASAGVTPMQYAVRVRLEGPF